MSSAFLELPAVRVRQPFGEFFVTRIPAAKLLKISFSNPLRLQEPRGKWPYGLGGNQRTEDKKREEKIGEFIDTVEATFPSSVILAANCSVDGPLDTEDGRRWTVVGRSDGTAVIKIPTEEALASIVDGQHRIHGFDYSKVPERRLMDVPCSVFFDLPGPYQAYVFATVNFHQKKVDRSLAFEMFGYDVENEPAEAWTPEKAAVFIARRLNTDPVSPLKGCIRIAPQNDGILKEEDETAFRVSMATVVDGILRLISANPQKDRNALFASRVGSGRQRKRLESDSSPLRRLYLEGNDVAVYTICLNYFAAASEAFIQNADPTSYLRKTVGIQALFDVLRELSRVAVETKVISRAFFADKLSPAKALDYGHPFFEQASGKGRIRLRNTLLCSVGLLNGDQLPERERHQYELILLGKRTRLQRTT